MKTGEPGSKKEEQADIESNFLYWPVLSARNGQNLMGESPECA